MNKLFRKLAVFSFAAVLVLDASIVLAGPVASSEAAAVVRECGVSASIIKQVDAGVDGGTVTEADGVALLAFFARICRAGLPSAPFEAKLAEGLAKKVPSIRIIPVLETMERQYALAMKILSDGNVVDADSVALLGDGLAKGVPVEVFRGYVEQYGTQERVMFRNGLAMTSFLAQAGFDYALTGNILETGFKADSLTTPWRYFVRVVLLARKRGIDDVRLAEAARESLAGGGSPADVASALGFTSRDLSGRSIHR